MTTLHVDINTSPNGNAHAEINIGTTTNYTDREKEIAETISKNFQELLASFKKGSALIIEQNLDPLH